MITLPPVRTYQRQDQGADALARQPHDPTEEEIAELCREIQARWSKRERQKRIVGRSNRRQRVDLQVIEETAVVMTPSRDFDWGVW